MRVKTSGSLPMTVTDANLAPYVAVFVAAVMRPRGPCLVVIHYRLLKSMGHPPGAVWRCACMRGGDMGKIAGVKAEENVTQHGRGPASHQPNHGEQASAPDTISSRRRTMRSIGWRPA